MAFIFHVTASQELYRTTEEVHAALTSILAIFPSSAFLQSQRALLHYHTKDFEEAEQVFSAILTTDPHRLDHLDNYSNILYVMGMRAKLAFLAQLASNKKFPGRPLDKMKEWHESYGNILAQLGWSMRSFEYVH